MSKIYFGDHCENGKTLLTAITAFVNILLYGQCHDFSHILFGGKFIALNKKAGGIRPIIICYTLRRLAAKCTVPYACEKLQDFLSTRQAGMNVSRSRETIIHAARRFIDDMPADDVEVKLHISNASNSLQFIQRLHATLFS